MTRELTASDLERGQIWFPSVGHARRRRITGFSRRDDLAETVVHYRLGDEGSERECSVSSFLKSLKKTGASLREDFP